MMTHKEFHLALVALNEGRYCSTVVTVTHTGIGLELSYSAYVKTIKESKGWTLGYRTPEEALAAAKQLIDGTPEPSQSLDSLGDVPHV